MVSLLFVSVLTLFCYMVPSFILRKSGLVNDNFAKTLSVITLYVAQVAMLLHGFILEFDIKVFFGLCKVFVLAFISHIVFYIIAKLMFQKCPNNLRRVLQFGIVFANAGYMGIPVINDVLGTEYTIYVTVYIIWFNVFGFSLGRLIYTDDKKYISLKEIIINPAVIPIIIGMIIYVSGLGGVILDCIDKPGIVNQAVTILYKVLEVLKGMVAPVSMMVIGARLADTSFKGIWKDKNVYIFSAMRLLVFPAIIWALMRGLLALGIIDKTIMTIVLVLASTPAAALTTMFAELYDGDSAYAGKLVALTTLLSVVTMPLVSLLLYI